LVIVAGTPLDFRLGYGIFGDPPAPVVHLVDAPDQVSSHANPAAWVAGDLAMTLGQLLGAWELVGSDPERGGWATGLRATADAAAAADAALLAADTNPIHPARIYGELVPRLTDDTVVIGDGGDFVSFAGRFIEPARPGHWLDPGPFGCLGTGLGYALAAGTALPAEPSVLLLGDGAAGFSLMDVDTLVRHAIPTVMVMGNNSAWGLEKHPMRLLHSYDVAADLQPGLRYDEVVRALGGAGEVVTRASDIGPALDRAFASGVPYLVNVLTDPEAAYPRSTTGL
jgi:acetolactate synthase-1/2/3 large subunit